MDRYRNQIKPSKRTITERREGWKDEKGRDKMKTKKKRNGGGEREEKKGEMEGARKEKKRGQKGRDVIEGIDEKNRYMKI